MPVPTYDQFIEPVLRYLAKHPEGAPARDAHEAAADTLKIDAASRAEVLPSGKQPVYKNRAGWAHDRLKRAGLSESPRRGFWVLTEKGRAFAKTHTGPLDEATLDDLATAHNDVILGNDGPKEEPGASDPAVEPAPARSESPDDRLEAALVEIRASVGAELLATLGRVHPTLFEAIVLDVLHAMGYGASRSDLRRVGGTGDAGIDGIISLDRLGLEKVYVQAKRWQASVGRPPVQEFYGALAGQRASKGVFITTSTFTAQAVEFARSVEKIVLVDGAKLVDLMIEYEVGVTHKKLVVPKLDSDYFEEE